MSIKTESLIGSVIEGGNDTKQLRMMNIQSPAEEDSDDDSHNSSFKSLESGDLDRSMDSQEIEETKAEINQEIGLK